MPQCRYTNLLLVNLRAALKKMKPGQSVVVDMIGNSEIYRTAKEAGAAVTVRKVDGRGYRVWRKN